MKYFGCILLFLALSSIVLAQDLPVSDRSYNTAKETFRFAIVSDRTGGMRGGIFDGAIKKVEMMQPEFVLSVGDLIDGYTEDPKVWNDQWDEFDSIINQLSMPFYYVPGNHDTSNKLLTEAWRERHGKDYYHFKYKEILFLALNTDEIEGGGIGKDQIKYFEDVLADHKDVRWTLLFMHRPVWSYGDRMGYDGIEEALGARNYTVFSGHHHHYRYKLQNGMEHFTLATTGGGSWMRNPDIGELDHITWVTMKEEGPKVAHIDINEIYGKDLVPEEDYEDIQVLRQGNWLDVEPFVNDVETFTEFPITFTLTNDSEKTFNVLGKLSEQNGIRFEPELLEASIQKGTSKQVVIKAISAEGESSIANLNNSPLSFEMAAGFERETRDNISLTTSKRLFLDWIHTLPKVKESVTVDAELSDWKSTKWIDVRNPQYIKEDWDWKGEADGRFKFATQYDAENLYVAIQFYDELSIAEEELSARQDKFIIHVDLNPETEGYEVFELAWGGKETSAISNHEGIKAMISKNSSDQSLEVKIPFEQLINDLSDSHIRINIGIMDHDRPENTKPSVLWWRPIWGSEFDYKMSGMFWLEK